MRLRIRAFGQMGLRVLDGVTLFRNLIGGMQWADIVRFDRIKEYFRGVLVIRRREINGNVCPQCGAPLDPGAMKCNL